MFFELFTQKSFNRLIQEFIYNGLASLNPEVINTSYLLIGNLYYSLSSAILDIFETHCFKEPYTFVQQLYLSQVQQAAAIKHGCKYYRTLKPITRGIIY